MYFRDADPQRIWIEETTEAGQKVYNDVKLAKNSAHNYGTVQKTTGSVITTHKGLSKSDHGANSF